MLRQRYLELLVQAVVVYSIATHFVEVEWFDRHQHNLFFRWSERALAAFFTVEYLVRWAASRSWRYPLRPMALIDLAATLPFYLSFLVDLRSLRLVRLLRVLRLFKLTRQTTALASLDAALHRVRYEFAVIGFGVFVVCWCASLAIFELEREAQPEAFGRLSDAGWYVLATVTTVGYGDKVPITQEGRIVADGPPLASGSWVCSRSCCWYAPGSTLPVRRPKEVSAGWQPGASAC